MRAVALQAMAQLKRLRLRPLTCQFTAQQLPCVIIMACRCVLFLLCDVETVAKYKKPKTGYGKSSKISNGN
jgi:hypothetical protein